MLFKTRDFCGSRQLKRVNTLILESTEVPCTCILAYCLDDHLPAITMQNKDLEKQVRFFQSSVAQAFAERDNSLLEVLFGLLPKSILYVKSLMLYT